MVSSALSVLSTGMCHQLLVIGELKGRSVRVTLPNMITELSVGTFSGGHEVSCCTKKSRTANMAHKEGRMDSAWATKNVKCYVDRAAAVHSNEANNLTFEIVFFFLVHLSAWQKVGLGGSHFRPVFHFKSKWLDMQTVKQSDQRSIKRGISIVSICNHWMLFDLWTSKRFSSRVKKCIETLLKVAVFKKKHLSWPHKEAVARCHTKMAAPMKMHAVNGKPSTKYS